jgi:hypothetical protein
MPMPMPAPSRPRRAGALLPAAALAASLLLALVSCSDDEPATCPTFQVGAVQGYVRVAGSGASLTVGARAQDGVSNGQVVASTVSAADGWYRLDLPTGRYRLEVEPSRGTTIGGEQRDTLTVTPQIRRHDLVRGRAEFTLNLPDSFESAWFTLYLNARGSFGEHARARVEGGVLRFVFPVLQPAAYAARLSPSYGYSGGDSLRVGTESVATRAVDLRTGGATIAGHVTGSWQLAGVAVPYVSAADAQQRSLGDVICDADGAFALPLLEARPVRLQVRIDSSYQWLGGDGFASARVFAPAPGERLDGADLVESGLDVRLLGPGDWLVQRADIVVRDAGGQDLRTVTAFSARKVLGNLPAGRYYVEIGGACPEEIWAPQWYDGAATAAVATPIDLATGELRRLDITLATGGSIAGELRTAAGGIPALAYCRLSDANGASACRGDIRLFGAHFEFVGLPDGDYLLCATVPPGAWWWYPGTSDHTQATAITVTGHAAVTGLSWRLPEEPGKDRP